MFRRCMAAVIVLSVLLCLCVSAFAANSMQVGSMYVNTANGRALRFRSSKSTSADNVLAEIPYGTKVYVVNWDGTWARVRYNSAVGYVVKKHLSIARPEPYETVQAQRAAQEAIKQQEKELKAENSRLDHSRVKAVDRYDVTVRTGVAEMRANLYAEANLTGKILTSFEEGARLEVTQQNRDWARIWDPVDGYTGYMLLEELEPDIMEEELLEDE
ncbi:MAG: hypothetical protein J6J41_03670 [Clostridia bacterium]|nr:hypothetical protein [Clostridia bacterium]